MTLTLRSPAFVGSLLLYPGCVQDYLDRVRAADGTGLDRAVTDGINVYLSGLFSAGMVGTTTGTIDGVISQAASTIKASCILAGANTLGGCLVPVVGTAPTNVNFVPADYNRKLGLGDPSNATKYLNTNRDNAAEPQDSQSLSFYAASGTTGTMAITPAGGNGQSAVFISPPPAGPANSPFRCRGLGIGTRATGGVTGFIGVTRGTSANYISRDSGVNETITFTSQTPGAGNVFLFARNNINLGVVDVYSNMRCAFYHIGENLNLAVLQSLQDQLFATLQAVIP